MQKEESEREQEKKILATNHSFESHTQNAHDLR